jgi:hypothetical protein
MMGGKKAKKKTLELNPRYDALNPVSNASSAAEGVVELVVVELVELDVAYPPHAATTPPTARPTKIINAASGKKCLTASHRTSTMIAPTTSRP